MVSISYTFFRRPILFFLTPVSPEGSVSISADPLMFLYNEGDNISLFCSAEGGPSNEIQWRLNNETLASEDFLDLINITGNDDGGVYTCVVSNEAGSDEDMFTVNVSPVITQQPLSEAVPISVSISFVCEASGFPEPTYQWFKLGEELGGENVTGIDTSNLTFISTNFGDEGYYFCQVTSGDVVINSSLATLSSKSV